MPTTEQPRPALVTGFERFDPWPFNPSEQIVRHLAANAPAAARGELIAAVLPTEYQLAGQRLTELIEQHDPAIVLSLGLSGARDRVCLERFALNIDDVKKPDNANRVRQGEPIDPDGPAALKTNVDLLPILAELHAHDIDAEISNHAGTYVCNHVFYQGLRAVAARGNRAGCLFVHIPLPHDGLPAEQRDKYRWELRELILAVELILRQLERQRDALAAAR